MSSVGYKYKATLFTLNNIKIQTIKFKYNSSKVVTSSFIGSGNLSQGKTLDIATKDKLLDKVKAGATRCLIDGEYYLIVGLQNKDIAPIKQANRSIKDNILMLQ